jgi:hypothetical protein
MDWFFARNDGGRDSGFHDAGVEYFKGNFDRYLARELIQNSLDARFDQRKPVHVEFQLLKLDCTRVPGMHHLQETFRRCAHYWQDHAKARSFFQEATRLATQPELSALKVSDYNTTGVPGSDADRNKDWYSLVRCAGSSSKVGGEGGSFGIGKNAPFAASRLRTVLYSTWTRQGGPAFQGVSTLVSHQLPNGSIAQPTGFLGGAHGESIRRPADIPSDFRRVEQGLDIVALEYPAAPTWQNDLVYSVLDNFWPAIDFGDLVVTVGNQRIDRSNLAGLLETFGGQEDFRAHFFYKAYRFPSRVFQGHLPTLEECSLYLLTGDADLPKRVAMVRRTGMVIYQRDHLRSLVPFCGVFLCQNPKGNKVLGGMEPPRHDKWDPDHPEKGENKAVETEYMDFIRDRIRQLAPIDDSKVISIPDLNRFLPDDDETVEEPFDESESPSNNESPERSPLPERIAGQKIDPRHQDMQPGRAQPEGDEDETEATEGEGSGGGPGQGTNETEGGTGAGGGGKGEGSAHTDTGGKGGVRSKPAVPVRYRTFVASADSGVYNLLVARAGEGDQPVYLLLSTIGDDQKAPADVEVARFVDGTPIPIVGPGMFGPVSLAVEASLRIEVTLSDPIRVAMEVTAHEA